MPGELTGLIVKALRSLSPEEQDRVMAELLDARLQAPAMQASRLAPTGTATLHAGLGGLPDPASGQHVAALRESLALEAAGPWQAVPVRLPVELHERLRQWCQANDFTMAVVLRGLVARFLDEYGAPAGGTADQPRE